MYGFFNETQCILHEGVELVPLWISQLFYNNIGRHHIMCLTTLASVMFWVNLVLIQWSMHWTSTICGLHCYLDSV